MVKITINNFREIECSFMKYVSEVGGTLMLRIIDFQTFRKKVLKEYSEEEIQYFFKIFPYTLDTDINKEIKQFVARQEIEFYKGFQLIEINGKEYVLVDESSERLECWYLLDRIESQPIAFEEFAEKVFDDIVAIDTGLLLSGLNSNVKERNKKEGVSKYVDKGIDGGVYI